MELIGPRGLTAQAVALPVWPTQAEWLSSRFTSTLVMTALMVLTIAGHVPYLLRPTDYLLFFGCTILDYHRWLSIPVHAPILHMVEVGSTPTATLEVSLQPFGSDSFYFISMPFTLAGLAPVSR